MNILILIKLLVAHIIGDFFLQTDTILLVTFSSRPTLFVKERTRRALGVLYIWPFIAE